jgi:hypothetical protein
MTESEQPGELDRSSDARQHISMSVDHFRWQLMWHGDFVREVTLLEVARHGLQPARRRTKKRDRRRLAFLKRLNEQTAPSARGNARVSAR